MTNRELEILEMIKKNPLISQQGIADKLGIKSSSVAVHINSLTSQGIIAGKAYVINEMDYVSVIGGANVDIVGYPFEATIKADSNPGHVDISLGGVGRNIADYLVKLGNHTKLFTILGEDFNGDKILNDSTLAGIDMSHVKRTSSYDTGTYIAILDENKGLELAIASMNCIKELNHDYLNKHRETIANSQMIVMDTNLKKDDLRYAVEMFKDKCLFLDMVSHKKTLRAKDIIGHFHTITPDKKEAELLSDIPINEDKDLVKVAEYFHHQGVENVFITLGQEGVFYSDKDQQAIFEMKDKLMHKNATIDWDAFHAGLVHAHLEEMPMKDKVAFSAAAAIVSKSSYFTIDPEMSVGWIKQIMSQWKEKEIK